MNSTTGILTALSPPTKLTDTQPVNIYALNINGNNYVYAITRTSRNISQYSVDAVGTLTFIRRTTLDANPFIMTTVTINGIVYTYVCCQTATGTINMLSIDNSTGQTSFLSTRSITCGVNPTNISIATISNGNSYAYLGAGTGGGSKLVTFGISLSTGILNAIPSRTINIGHIACSTIVLKINNINYLYLSTTNGENRIYMFSIINVGIDSGSFTALSPAYIDLGFDGDALFGVDKIQRMATINIAGNNYLYVTNSNFNTVSMFSVDSSGLLTALSPATIGTGSNSYPRTITTVTNNGNSYAYVANYFGNTLSMYSIDNNGMLWALPTATIGTGENPRGITSLSILYA
jgi:6-phosphogluconolactonase (cycloisomerase 2 family)